MAWWNKKDKKARQPRRERLEIPADVWEKCEACGHTDIREKFARNMNVCPNCDYHRRIRASEYCALLLDEGSMEEVEVDLRSTDPLGFPEYPARLKKATAKVGETDALLACTGMLDDLPVMVYVDTADDGYANLYTSSFAERIGRRSESFGSAAAASCSMRYATFVRIVETSATGSAIAVAVSTAGA